MAESHETDDMIGGQFEVGELIATGGGPHCQDPRCTRDGEGRCRSNHCAACGQPSSYQGHYSRVAWWDPETRKPVMLDDWGFSCQPEYKARVAALRAQMEAEANG